MQSTQYLCHMLGAALAVFVYTHDAHAQTDVALQNKAQQVILPIKSH